MYKIAAQNRPSLIGSSFPSRAAFFHFEFRKVEYNQNTIYTTKKKLITHLVQSVEKKLEKTATCFEVSKTTHTPNNTCIQ